MANNDTVTSIVTNIIMGIVADDDTVDHTQKKKKPKVSVVEVANYLL